MSTKHTFFLLLALAVFITKSSNGEEESDNQLKVPNKYNGTLITQESIGSLVTLWHNENDVLLDAELEAKDDRGD